MADFTKIKAPSKSRLPPPPAPSDAPANLSIPETLVVDGRSARATGRTHQLATRVREEFYHELRRYAADNRLKLVEVLEKGHEALKAQDKSSG